MRASGADLILLNGMNLEVWFEQFIDNLGPIPSVMISEGIETMFSHSGSYEGMPNSHTGISLDNTMIYNYNIRDAMSLHAPKLWEFTRQTLAHDLRKRVKLSHT